MPVVPVLVPVGLVPVEPDIVAVVPLVAGALLDPLPAPVRFVPLVPALPVPVLPLIPPDIPVTPLPLSPEPPLPIEALPAAPLLAAAVDALAAAWCLGAFR